MDKPLKTLTQATAYVAKLFNLTGRRHVIFYTPKGSMAWDMGFRFGTCEESERAEYEADGAVFVEDCFNNLPG